MRTVRPNCDTERGVSGSMRWELLSNQLLYRRLVSGWRMNLEIRKNAQILGEKLEVLLKYEEIHCTLLNQILTFYVSKYKLWRMESSGKLHRVALVITNVSEEFSASFIGVTRIGELGTTLAVTSVRRLLVRASVVPSSPILVTLMKEALSSSETSVII
jgi:hypothetical protein